MIGTGRSTAGVSQSPSEEGEQGESGPITATNLPGGGGGGGGVGALGQSVVAVCGSGADLSGPVWYSVNYSETTQGLGAPLLG